jgi:hypothetical protein
MSSERYKLSFTSGSLFILESIIIVGLYLEEGDWKSTREKVIARNLIQTRKLSTLKKISLEITHRLTMLREPELQFLVEASRQDQGYVLWMAICRRYTFIADFAVEVLRENFLSRKNTLTYDDYDLFFNRKSEWHPELEAISRNTGQKLRQILFRMLREADLLTSKNLINAAIFSENFRDLIKRYELKDFMYFPVLKHSL